MKMNLGGKKVVVIASVFSLCGFLLGLAGAISIGQVTKSTPPILHALPKGYTLDSYTVEKETTSSCVSDADCTTPPEYAVQSRCPFVSLCRLGHCSVVCPAHMPLSPVPQTSQPCGIENCHGMDVTCGPNPVEACTEEYRIGDKCRSHATCTVNAGSCGVKKDSEYDSCVSCVTLCQKQHEIDPEGLFSCESECK